MLVRLDEFEFYLICERNAHKCSIVLLTSTLVPLALVSAAALHFIIIRGAALCGERATFGVCWLFAYSAVCECAIPLYGAMPWT